MRWSPCVLLLLGCAPKKASGLSEGSPVVERETEVRGEYVPVEPVDPPANADGTDPFTPVLTVTPDPAVAGAPLGVTFVLLGGNGCYRQTEAVRSVAGRVVTWDYETSYVGEVCTMGLVHGGFEDVVTLAEPGAWTLEVRVDVESRARTTVEAVAP